MKNSQRFIYYFAAAVLVALVVASLYVGGRSASSAGTQNSAANVSPGRSYEEIVGDQQKRWGHGHTLSDPAPASESSTGR